MSMKPYLDFARWVLKQVINDPVRLAMVLLFFVTIYAIYIGHK